VKKCLGCCTSIKCLFSFVLIFYKGFIRKSYSERGKNIKNARIMLCELHDKRWIWLHVMRYLYREWEIIFFILDSFVQMVLVPLYISFDNIYSSNVGLIQFSCVFLPYTHNFKCVFLLSLLWKELCLWFIFGVMLMCISNSMDFQFHHCCQIVVIIYLCGKDSNFLIK
jgi:hypothetical protein